MILAASLHKGQIRQNLLQNSILFNFSCISFKFRRIKAYIFAMLTSAVANASVDMTIRYAF